MPHYFVAAPKGVEDLLELELQKIGVADTKVASSGVHFRGEPALAHRVLMWSRIASRVLCILVETEINEADQLYTIAHDIDWPAEFGVRQTFAVDATVSGGLVTHSRYAALRVKDAVVDRFRERFGDRPSIDREQPDLLIALSVRGPRLSLGIDLAGGPLHRRGHRGHTGEAPLKENLAAAILMRAGWLDLIKDDTPIIDPMCGSGTLLIEAALMAADTAPGLDRAAPRSTRLDQELWRDVVAEAEQRRADGKPPSVIIGADRDGRVLKTARDNAARAGLGDAIEWRQLDLDQWTPENTPDHPGLLVMNPPYGERLEDLARLVVTYTRIGQAFERCFQGWRAAVFTGAGDLARRIGYRAHKRHKLLNGPIACDLLHFDINAGKRSGQSEDVLELSDGGAVPIQSGARDLANRLKKNLKGLRKWLIREELESFRAYDADLPEYNAAIDVYGDFLVVQEYQAPDDIPETKVRQRLEDILLVAPEILDVPRDQVILKQRRRQKGEAQYKPLDQSGRLIEISEGDLTFLVNLWDYLDTGLFNDHRPMRRLLRDEAEGKRFLNLFAYTGTATVAAAAGGARSTMTVDLSSRYLDWAQKNLYRNDFPIDTPRHRFEAGDVNQWLEQERNRYDLIFVDPPTFSNSKRLRHDFDVQRDHPYLLRRIERVLAPSGVIYFSNNRRGFKLYEPGLAKAGLKAEDITGKTIPPDYARTPKIHQCWRITRV